MGLQFSHNSASSFLYIGITLANLHRSGNIPVSNIRLIILQRIDEKKLLKAFRI